MQKGRFSPNFLVAEHDNARLGSVGQSLGVRFDSVDAHGGDDFDVVKPSESIQLRLIDDLIGVEFAQAIVFFFVRVKPDFVVRAIFGHAHGLPKELGGLALQSLCRHMSGMASEVTS